MFNHNSKYGEDCVNYNTKQRILSKIWNVMGCGLLCFIRFTLFTLAESLMGMRKLFENASSVGIQCSLLNGDNMEKSFSWLNFKLYFTNEQFTENEICESSEIIKQNGKRNTKDNKLEETPVNSCKFFMPCSAVNQEKHN